MQQQDIINEITGNWGRWQFRTSFLIFLCKIPSAWFMACIIFTAPMPRYGEFFCRAPDHISTRFTNHSHLVAAIHPPKVHDNDDATAIGYQRKLDYCNVYSMNPAHWPANLTDLTNGTYPRGSIIPCEAFHHKTDFISLVNQFDLVCHRGVLVAVTQFFHLFGVLTGGIIATKLLVYVSPRKLMLIGMITQVFCGLITGTATAFELHVFFRYLSAVCCAQMFTAGPVIFQEITGGIYRTSVTCLYENFWSIGVIMLPGIAYYFPGWTNIYMAISLPTLGYILLWFLIPDAPRWLLRERQPDKTKKVLLQATKVNGMGSTLPPNIGTKLSLMATEFLKEDPPESWTSLWSTSTAKECIRMCALHLAWAVYVTSYNGMLLNVKSFSREYLSYNTIVFGCSEIIGVLIAWFLILKCNNKKWLLAGGFNIVAGLLACSVYLVPDELFDVETTMIVRMIPASLTKIAVSTAQAVLFTCTGELVRPTQRKICAFSCIVWARIWLLCAPFIGVLMTYHPMLPLAVFGAMNTCGGIATTVLSMPKSSSSASRKIALPIEPLVTSEKLIEK